MSTSAQASDRALDVQLQRDAGISHLIARLEKRGLVVRRPDPDDAGYTNAVLTERGWEMVELAAPGHVATVRKLLFDGLDDAALHQLQNAANRIVAALSRSELPLAPTIRKALHPLD